MPDWDAMIRAKLAAAPDLLKRPDVTGIGVGYREKNGQVTGEPAIRVYVEHKRLLNEYPLGLASRPRSEDSRQMLSKKGMMSP